MDARNDDSSAGSDSLDKSLQRKCVVDDMGQGEGKSQENCLVSSELVTTSPADISEQHQQNQQCGMENTNNINATHQHYKTEKIVGDGGVAIAIEQSLTKQQDVMTRKCDLNERKTDDDRVSATSLNHIDNNSSCSNNNSIINNTNNSNAFETKVTQISKNLKETTLAEYDVTTRTSSTSSSSTSSSSPSSDAEPLIVGGAASELLDQNSQLSVNSESVDDQDGRSKKVRFHPDVKENDGGNRVIPKKKKKLKNNANGEDDATLTSSQRTSGTDDDDDMDYEEEEDVIEEEEEFNLAKTIAEAQNYLKLHPLTFVGTSFDKGGGPNSSSEVKCSLNGLMQEEDLPQLSESSEDEDFYEEMQPECGVERILGKQIKNGKAELLVRFVHTPDLCWESEERISAMCPNMINKYELNRERRQERLMRHVAKRQNVRQRYTDF